MHQKIEPGMVVEKIIEVTCKDCIKVGEEQLQIYSTPALLDDIESSCAEIIQQQSKSGDTSVGIEVTINHTAPVPVKSRVSLEITVDEVNGRLFVFNISCRDNSEVIATAQHKRMCVNAAGIGARIKQKMLDLTQS